MSNRRRGRNEGSVHKRKDGLWEGKISLGYDAGGKRIRPTVYGKTKREVLEKIQAMQRDFLEGHSVKPEVMTVREYFGDWLTDKRNSVAESTLAKYQYHVSHIVRVLGHRKLADITYRTIMSFFDALEKDGLGTRTIFDVSTTLRAALEDAVRRKVLRENPALLVTRPSGKKEATFMTPEELRYVLRAAQGERLHAAFVVLADTGLRPGELLGLSWKHVNIDERTIRVRQSLREHKSTDDGRPRIYLGPVKSKKSRRTVTLSTTAIAALKRWRTVQAQERMKLGPDWRGGDEHVLAHVADDFEADGDIVFTNTIGGLLPRTNFAKRDLARVINGAVVLRAAIRVGVDPDATLAINRPHLPRSSRIGAGYRISLPDEREIKIDKSDLLPGVSLHTFRHTHASLLIANGVDIKTISERLGHERISITLDTYGHLLPGMDDAAADSMDKFMATL